MRNLLRVTNYIQLMVLTNFLGNNFFSPPSASDPSRGVLSGQAIRWIALQMPRLVILPPLCRFDDLLLAFSAAQWRSGSTAQVARR
jgi:hypothetical protein